MAPPAGYAYASQITVTNTQANAVALPGATGSTLGYTCEVTLTSTTTPTASSVFGQIQAIDTTNAYVNTTNDTVNFPSGYPKDLTVWYNGAQIDCDVLQCSSSQIVLAFKLQTTLAAAATDSTSYVLAWGNAHPTVLANLNNVNIWGDNFLGSSLNASYRTSNATVTVANGQVQLVAPSGGATNTPPLIAISTGTQLDLDVRADVMASVAESSWTVDGTRVGLFARSNGTTATYAFVAHNTGTKPFAFLQEVLVWGSAYTGYANGSSGNTLRANQWATMKYRAVGAANTSTTTTGRWGKVWISGTAEPAWAQNGSNGDTTYTTAEAGLYGNNSTAGSTSPDNTTQTSFRYLRVRMAVAAPPTLTTAAPTTSGTTYPQSLSATISLAGSVTRTVGKGLVAQTAISGTITRTTSRTLPTGTMALTGTGLRGTGKNTSGTLAPSGVLGRGTGHGLAAGLTVAGGLSRGVTHLLTGTLTGLGAALAKGVGIPLAASLSGLAAALTTAKNATAHADTQALTASVSLTGALGRGTTHALPATLALAGATRRGIGHGIAATVTPAGVLNRGLGRGISATIGVSGTVRRGCAHGLAATVTVSGVLGKGITHVVSGATLALAGVLGTAYLHITGRAFPRAMYRVLPRPLVFRLIAQGGAMSVQPVIATIDPPFIGSTERGQPFTLDYSAVLGQAETISSVAATIYSFSPTVGSQGPGDPNVTAQLLEGTAIVDPTTTPPTTVAANDPKAKGAQATIGNARAQVGTSYRIVLSVTTSTGRIVADHIRQIDCTF